jgi:hypothetical protein
MSDDGEARHMQCRRGLGLLVVLPDELILELLRQLAAIDLARIGQCSKALYVFSHEEELWRHQVLSTFQGAFRFQGSWLSTFVFEFSGSPPLPVAAEHAIRVDGFYSDPLVHSYRCAHEDLTRFAQVDNIERRSGLTLDEFIEQYARPNKPVILSDVVDKWPAFRTWSKQTLLERHGDTVFKIGMVDMKLRHYWQYADQAHEETPLYLFDNDFTLKAPEMHSEYTTPPYFQQDFFALLDGDGCGGDGCGEAGEDDLRPSYRWILIGPQRSGSTFHKDPNFTSAWNGLISGCKKWILFPPHVTPPGVFPSADEYDVTTPISVAEWFINFYDHARSLNPIECNQRPGDLIFIPNQWWHTALNIEQSIAVTQNFVAEANLLPVLDFLERNHKPVLKRTLESRIRQQHPEIMANIDEQRRKRELPKYSLWENITGCSNATATATAAAAAAGGSSTGTASSSNTNNSFSFSFM